MRASPLARCLRSAVALAWVAFGSGALRAADVTFYSYSDSHYGADHGGKAPPKTQSNEVAAINSLPGVDYPPAIGGTVDKPRAIIMQGDLINDGAREDKYHAQWANYVADFGVNGEGRCRFPVFEGVGNNDVNPNLFVFNKVKERNGIRKRLGYITDVSPNGYHYSWDWDGVHFVNVNLFPGNVWEGEADTYGRGHDPLFARDFLVADLKKHVGDSGRPVIVVQHFRPIDENWWTYSAADKYHKVLQDYNVIAILVGHQGGGVNNTWRGMNWISSNGQLIVCRIKDHTFSAVSRSATAWGPVMQKKIFFSHRESGLPAVLNNGTWATRIGPRSATLSGKVVYEAQAPTEVRVYWGTTDGGAKPDAWQHVTSLGVLKAGQTGSTEVTGLKPWTLYHYRTAATNSKGTAWAAASIPFATAGVLPEGWATVQLGHEQRPGGGATFNKGVFTVRGSGRDIAERGEPIDNGQFAYRALHGDGEIKARVTTAEIRTREPKIGVMMREKIADGSTNVAMLIVPRRGVRLSARTEENAGSNSQMNTAVKTVPCWVKLVRSGNTFTGYLSQDDQSWQPVGRPVTVEMGRRIFVGLAVTSGSRDESRLHTSAFEDVSVSGKRPQPLLRTRDGGEDAAADEEPAQGAPQGME